MVTRSLFNSDFVDVKNNYFMINSLDDRALNQCIFLFIPN